MQRATLTREQVISVAAIKWLRDQVLTYKGRPEKLKDWLLIRLDDMNRTADEILAAAFDQAIPAV